MTSGARWLRSGPANGPPGTACIRKNEIAEMTRRVGIVQSSLRMM